MKFRGVSVYWCCLFNVQIRTSCIIFLVSLIPWFSSSLEFGCNLFLLNKICGYWSKNKKKNSFCSWNKKKYCSYPIYKDCCLHDLCECVPSFCILVRQAQVRSHLWDACTHLIGLVPRLHPEWIHILSFCRPFWLGSITTVQVCRFYSWTQTWHFFPWTLTPLMYWFVIW